jgi:hypothetical protein
LRHGKVQRRAFRFRWRAAGSCRRAYRGGGVIGLLQGDRSSYLSQDPDWQPFLPTIDPVRAGDDFTMIDLLRFAAVG